MVDSAAALVAGDAELSLDGAVYKNLGIAGGIDAARANPNCRATVIGEMSKLASFLASVGIIDESNRDERASLGLVAPASVAV